MQFELDMGNEMASTRFFIHLKFLSNGWVFSGNKHLACQCRVLHVMLLAVNAIALRVLLAASGGSEDSVFAKKEYTRAVILVASQVPLV